LLNADWQEWNREGDGMLNGFVTSDRKLILKKITKRDFRITRAAACIMGFEEKGSSLTMKIQAGSQPQRSISFRCAKAPSTVTLANQRLAVVHAGRDFRVILPDMSTPADLIIEF
jgi:hypothetical protein